MPITITAAKAKARRLQQWVRDKILSLHTELTDEDVRSTPMSVNGEDVQLSPTARELFPYSVECKALKRLTIYNYYDQSVGNANGHEPLLVLKSDRRKPLVVVDADHFFKLLETIKNPPRNRW